MSDKKKEAEEFSEDEPTPVFQTLRLTEWEYHAMRIVVAVDDQLMRDFYATAYQRMAEKRRDWKPSQAGERFPWLAKPMVGKRVSAATFEHQVAELTEWAEKDDIAVGNAYYTAIHDYLLERSRKLDVDLADTLKDN